MTQSRNTPLSLRTQLVALANGLKSSEARDYFANERTAQKLGALKAALERDGFKDAACQGAAALRIAEILQGNEQIGPEAAHEVLVLLIEAIAATLGVELPSASGKRSDATSAPAAPARTHELRMVSSRKLGEILVQMSLLTPAQVEQALAHQRMTGCRLGDALVEMRMLSKGTIESALRVQGVRRNALDDPWRSVS